MFRIITSLTLQDILHKYFQTDKHFHCKDVVSLFADCHDIFLVERQVINSLHKTKLDSKISIYLSTHIFVFLLFAFAKQFLPEIGKSLNLTPHLKMQPSTAKDNKNKIRKLDSEFRFYMQKSAATNSSCLSILACLCIQYLLSLVVIVLKFIDHQLCAEKS